LSSSGGKQKIKWAAADMDKGGQKNRKAAKSLRQQRLKNDRILPDLRDFEKLMPFRAPVTFSIDFLDSAGYCKEMKRSFFFKEPAEC
jgi:hypothetical protein